MVTGASTADLAVILIDARKGVVEQTRRHSYIRVMLGIPHVVFAVNKMDLVEHSEPRFEDMVSEFEGFVEKLGAMPSSGQLAGSAWSPRDGRLVVPDVTYIPISALDGDNVVERSERMGWYASGPPLLLDLLEEVEVADDHPYDLPARFPVQWVIRPGIARDPRRGLPRLRGPARERLAAGR